LDVAHGVDVVVKIGIAGTAFFARSANDTVGKIVVEPGLHRGRKALLGLVALAAIGRCADVSALEGVIKSLVMVYALLPMVATFTIKRALGIAAVYTEISSMRIPASDGTLGFKIDLLIDRKDNCINLCEIKFHSGPFTITPVYYQQLIEKRRRYGIFVLVSGWYPDGWAAG
jgi:hypothetical protein